MEEIKKNLSFIPSDEPPHLKEIQINKENLSGYLLSIKDSIKKDAPYKVVKKEKIPPIIIFIRKVKLSFLYFLYKLGLYR